MFKGSLYSTTDLEVVRNMMGTSKIVLLGDSDQMFIQTTGAILGSVLLPPYQALMASMDNDVQNFTMIYENYLVSKEATNFLAVIFRALYNGTNILLYAPKDDSALFFNQLFSHIYNRYGIVVGNQNVQFDFNPNFSWIISSIMYIFEVFNVDEFLLNYPVGVQLTDDVVMKLIHEVQPYIQDTSFEGYKKYFFEYKERIKNNNNKFLTTIVTRG